MTVIRIAFATLAVALAASPAALAQERAAPATDAAWRNDLGLAVGLVSGTGVRLARRFPGGVRVGLVAGYLEPGDPGGLGTRFASVGTEVAVELTHGRIVRLLGLAGLGWARAEDFDPDGDQVPEDVEVLALGAGVGLEVLYYRNLSLTLHVLLGADLLGAAVVASPELTLSYGL